MRLYLLQFGIFAASGTPFPGYLIQTDDGRNVLIDTGWPRSLIGAYDAPVSPITEPLSGDAATDGTIAVARGTRITEEDSVERRLAALGLAPRDIDSVICTHFDLDHAGNHDLFPHAEIVVQREHAAIARAHPRFLLFGAPWAAPTLRYRLVDGDMTLLPGIELIETSGHVPGHQSVLVRLPQTGPVLLAIDAIASRAHLDPRTPLRVFDMDEAQTRATTRRLIARAEQEGVQLIVFGHDAEQWRTLKMSPDSYA